MESRAVRLQAYLSRAGVASRRACEELIRAGRVRVNGGVAELGMSVDPTTDRVEVDGQVVSPQRTQWVAVHKPKGYVTTREDPEGRKTVYDLLPDHLRHLFHVGRLDRDSSGLLLLTNDGVAANRLLHPRYGTTKEYWADVEGLPTDSALRQLVTGVELEDGTAKAESVEVRSEVRPGIIRLAIVMREGKRREVRRMLEAVGHPVRRLFRRRFGPVEIGRLAPGKWRYLTAEEMTALGSRDERPATPARGPRGPRGAAAQGGPRGAARRARPTQKSGTRETHAPPTESPGKRRGKRRNQQGNKARDRHGHRRG